MKKLSGLTVTSSFIIFFRPVQGFFHWAIFKPAKTTEFAQDQIVQTGQEHIVVTENQVSVLLHVPVVYVGVDRVVVFKEIRPPAVWAILFLPLLYTVPESVMLVMVDNSRHFVYFVLLTGETGVCKATARCISCCIDAFGI